MILLMVICWVNTHTHTHTCTHMHMHAHHKRIQKL